jgi:hypothetical protein
VLATTRCIAIQPRNCPPSDLAADHLNLIFLFDLPKLRKTRAQPFIYSKLRTRKNGIADDAHPGDRSRTDERTLARQPVSLCLSFSLPFVQCLVQLSDLIDMTGRGSSDKRVGYRQKQRGELGVREAGSQQVKPKFLFVEWPASKGVFQDATIVCKGLLRVFFVKIS